MLKFKTISMRNKIMLSCTGCVVLALMLQAVLHLRSSSDVIYNQAHEISSSIMANLQEELYRFNRDIENSMIQIYNKREFMRDLSRGYIAENPQHSRLAFDLVQGAFVPAQNVVALYIYTSSRELISFYRHAHTPRYNYPMDIFVVRSADLEIVEDFLESDERIMLITSHYNASRETRLIRHVLKIYRNATDFIGFIVCDIDPRPLRRIVDNHRVSDGQIIWLQPDNDMVALSSGENNHYENLTFLSISESIKQNAHETDMRHSIDGYELFSIQSPMYNFTAHLLMPQTVLRENQIAVRNNAIFVSILILVLISLVFIIVSHTLTKPLNYVMETMGRIKSGNTSLRLKKMRDDEIGKLGQEFNEMLDETERLIKAHYESQILVNDAKYKALQAQVNPHFLYNTLETMSSISSTQNSSTVNTLCKALSNIFRYSIDMNEPYSTLENEIFHIKNYMFVMNVRMNNSVEMKFDVDSSLLKKRIPRLSIQPLVENAINHGLKDKRGDKEVIISAKLDGELLIVLVEDNGIGTDAKSINERMKLSTVDALEKSSSIGLDNINARLKLLYGDSFGILVESDNLSGTKIKMHIPAAFDEDERDEK